MRKIDYDSRIRVYRSRKFTICTLALIMAVFFAALIRECLGAGLDWPAIAVPVCLFGSIFLLFPQTEEWYYRPWQSRSRKVEQHLDH